MLENEKVSQFKMIKNVFKYEFISTARVFVPVYGALLVISLFAGIFLFSEEFFDGFNENKTMLLFILFPIFIIFVCATAIITLLQLGRRFRKSLLGNEAYLNLTLPISLWAHLVARILSAFVWLLIYSAILSISLLLFYQNLW